MQLSDGNPRAGARRIGAVERALAVLDALGEAGGEIGTNELARRTGINASSVSRLLATLVDAGYAEPTASGRYRLGVRLLQLGSHALDGLDLRELVRPALEMLAATTGETATLSVSGGRDAVTLDFARSPQAVQSVAQLGRPSVAHATATGKVLLAFGDVPLPSGRLTRFTDRTIADQRSLEREIACVRERGWAAAVGEREPDLAAVAAPVRGSRGELVAIVGVQGPASRFDDPARERAAQALLRAVAELSVRLGWEGSPGAVA
jgi:IclR family acetate operon transcriptional repressor